MSLEAHAAMAAETVVSSPGNEHQENKDHVERVRAKAFGRGRRRLPVVRCTCEAGGSMCVQSRLDLLFPSTTGPKCRDCTAGDPPRCTCECDGCRSMRIDSNEAKDGTDVGDGDHAATIADGTDQFKVSGHVPQESEEGTLNI